MVSIFPDRDEVDLLDSRERSMFFSIILPIYNAENTIENTLKSIEMQTFSDYEVLMIDDGSTDRSRIICEYYTQKNNRFKYYKKKNQGVSSARNYGLKCAKGEFIAFIDSDDLYMSNYLEELYQLVCKEPGYDNYWCGFFVVKENRITSVEKTEIHIFSDENEVSLHKRSEIMSLHEKWLDSTLWNKIYRRDIIEQKALVMNEKLSLGEDLLFNYNYLDNVSEVIVILNKPLYVYHQYSNGSLDSKYRSDLKKLYDILDDRVFQYLHTWNISKHQIKKFYSSIFYSQEKIMKNTFRKECPMTKREKYRYNNMILRSRKFRTAIKEADCYIHPLYRWAYAFRQYAAVQLIDCLVELKNRKKGDLNEK